jgi:hypothetical protein
MAQQFGGQASTPEQVPLSLATSAGLAECFHCFPADVPLDAKPCQVLVAGSGSMASFLSGGADPTADGKGS